MEEWEKIAKSLPCGRNVRVKCCQNDRSQVTKLLENTKEINGCLEWQGSVNSLGYGQKDLGKRVNGKRRRVRVHRHIMILLYGEASLKNKMVCHKCNNRACINPEHLYIGDAKTNYEDMVNAGNSGIRSGKGQASARSKLTVRDVLYIRKHYGKIRTRDLAKKFSVNRRTIFDVASRRSWAHV